MMKACFFDMDGTLLSHTTNSIPQSTKEALKQLKDKGIKIILATGRHLLELEDLPGKDIKFDGYILLNGHICLDAQKHCFFEDGINKEDGDLLVRLFEEKRFPMMLVEKHRFYCNYIDETVKIAQKAISSPLPAISTYQGDTIYQVLPYLEKEFPYPLKNCTITRWNRYGLDINAKGEGKVDGIKRFMEYYNFSQNEIMAFGDAENDRDMLQFAGIGVAMGNADEKTKACANFITKHIDEDGIAYALKTLKIL